MEYKPIESNPPEKIDSIDSLATLLEKQFFGEENELKVPTFEGCSFFTT